MNPAVSDAPATFHPASSSDFIPLGPLRGLQSLRLRQVIAQTYEHVSQYRRRMQKHGLAPADIRGVEDLAKLPLTTKADLRDAYPTGMFLVPVQQIRRLHCGGGAPGGPIVAAYTRRDLDIRAELMVRGLACCGIRPGDILQNACGPEVLSDGPALLHAADTLGCTVLPVPIGDTLRQITLLKDFGVSVLCCTPNYFLYLAERADKSRVDLGDLPLRTVVLVGESCNEAVRRRIEQSAAVKAYDLYGLPEMLGPDIGAECCRQEGLHVFEDHFYPEIIDPATGVPLPDGQEGELVLTTLSSEAMPLVRYRTRDLTAILTEPCSCGRT